VREASTMFLTSPGSRAKRSQKETARIAKFELAPGSLDFPELLMPVADDNLEEEYRLTRAALVRAGLDMNGSIDALYRDWRRWRDKSNRSAPGDRSAIRNADEWWARHLAQFRSLIDPVHVSARSVRAGKDERERARHTSAK
jgi:hypothetical protein